MNCDLASAPLQVVHSAVTFRMFPAAALSVMRGFRVAPAKPETQLFFQHGGYLVIFANSLFPGSGL